MPHPAARAQDCGKPYYTSNYLAFFFAIRQAWPQLRLVANCDMGRDAPTQVRACFCGHMLPEARTTPQRRPACCVCACLAWWSLQLCGPGAPTRAVQLKPAWALQLYDWHWYTSATALFHARSTFDAAPRDGPGIFMSVRSLHRASVPRPAAPRTSCTGGTPRLHASSKAGRGAAAAQEAAVFDWEHQPVRPLSNMEVRAALRPERLCQLLSPGAALNAGLARRMRWQRQASGPGWSATGTSCAWRPLLPSCATPTTRLSARPATWWSLTIEGVFSLPLRSAPFQPARVHPACRGLHGLVHSHQRPWDTQGAGAGPWPRRATMCRPCLHRLPAPGWWRPTLTSAPLATWPSRPPARTRPARA